MSIPQRQALNRGIFSLVGPIHECSVARGGDLFIIPSDTRQRDALLKLDQSRITGRQISCKLPSSLVIKGVIKGVSQADSDDEIKEVLANQDVSDVYQVIRPDGPRSDILFLTFSSRLPQNVTIAVVSFPVQPTRIGAKSAGVWGTQQPSVTAKQLSAKPVAEPKMRRSPVPQDVLTAPSPTMKQTQIPALRT